MEVNQVRFGNYSIGNSNTQARKREDEGEEQPLIQIDDDNESTITAEDFFTALDIASIQNKAHINFNTQEEVNPKDYLDQDRIQDIEAMMEGFEYGVEEVANIIEEEFPGVFAADMKNALAAQVYAQE